METRDISELHANPKNPRTIDKQQFAALQKSITEFGDLSGVVFNVQTGQLVGGHMRTKSFSTMPGETKIYITQRFPQPTRTGTTAVGTIVKNDEQYAYREVDWGIERETAANISANRIEGDWDRDLLAEANNMLLEHDPELLALTGQTDDEIAALNGLDENLEDKPDDPRSNMSFKFSDQQIGTIEQALTQMKGERSFQDEPNPDYDANALFYICTQYLNQV